MKKLIPYITVTDTIKAIELYKKAFSDVEDLHILMLDHVEGMEQFKGKVGHAHIRIYENELYFCDATDHELIKGNNIHFTIELETKEELKNAFYTLKEDGIVYQEMMSTFWCDTTCYLKDKYGIFWSLIYGMK